MTSDQTKTCEKCSTSGAPACTCQGDDMTTFDHQLCPHGYNEHGALCAVCQEHARAARAFAVADIQSGALTANQRRHAQTANDPAQHPEARQAARDALGAARAFAVIDHKLATRGYVTAEEAWQAHLDATYCDRSVSPWREAREAARAATPRLPEREGMNSGGEPLDAQDTRPFHEQASQARTDVNRFDPQGYVRGIEAVDEDHADTLRAKAHYAQRCLDCDQTRADCDCTAGFLTPADERHDDEPLDEQRRRLPDTKPTGQTDFVDFRTIAEGQKRHP